MTSYGPILEESLHYISYLRDPLNLLKEGYYKGVFHRGSLFDFYPIP